MFWRLLTLLGILGLAVVIEAQTADQEVVRAENARIQARQKGDSAVLSRLVAEDFVQVGSRGQLLAKKEAISIPAAPSTSLSDLNVQTFGEVAVVVGVAGPKSNIRFTRVWQRQNGQWMNVFGHITTIAQVPAPTGTAQIAPTIWPAGKTPDERNVLEVQRALNETFAKKDVGAYEKLTADTFLRIGAGGQVIPRAQFLKQMAATPDVQRQVSSNSDIRFRAYGPIAITTYIDRTRTGSTRMSRVFIKQNGTWKQLVGQSTLITE